MINDKKLSILFSHYGIKDGDGFGRSFLLAKNLAKFGHHVTFLTSQNKEFIFPFKKEEREGVELISFPDIVPRSMRKGGLGPLNILLKTWFALRRKYDVVHSDSGHRPSSGLPCLISRKFKGAIYVSEWWDFFGKGGIYDEMPRWYQLTLGNFDTIQEVNNKKQADGVVALSEFTAQRALKLGKPAESVLLLHGGADVDKIKVLDGKTFKKKYGIAEDSLTFGFIGMNEGELKDIVPFLDAINELKEDIPVNWFSTGQKLSEETKKKYGIGSELIEFGWVDYSLYSEYLACADVFILLSQNNIVNKARWPNKLGDYFAADRPILANPEGEVRNLMDKYPDSFIKTGWNKTEIKEKITFLFKNRNEILTEAGLNREIAQNDISWQIKAKELEQFYFFLLEKKSANG